MLTESRRSEENRKPTPRRVAIVCTHPIQYHSPTFRALAQESELDIKVFYGWEGPGKSIDHGFGRAVEWDIPLLDGYEYEFIENVSKNPGSHRFRGIDLPSLNSKIRTWNADAVLVYGWCYKAHLNALRYFKNRIPVLFRGDSTLLNQSGGIKSLLRKHFLSWVYSHIDIALFVGSHNREYFLAHGMSQKQLIFSPHAIDNSRFAAPESEVAGLELRRLYGIEDDEVVVLLPAKLEPIKNPEILIEAFRSIDHPRCHLVFAGSGPLESKLRSMAGDRTHFLGFKNQTEMPAVYYMADLIALTSRSETWGLVLNEAMACGRAIIASNTVGAAIDLITPSVNGWVFNEGNLDSLIGILNSATREGRLALKTKGNQSRMRVDDWSIQNQVAGMLSVFQKIVV